MRVFLTGATGFIGSAIVPELISAGHQVLGMARSDEGARALMAAGAQAHRGDLEDLESLRSGAAGSDAVIHTAFRHDFSRFAESCEQDKRAIEAIGGVLQGSSRPFIVSSGIGVAQGRVATEDDPPLSPSPHSACIGSDCSRFDGARSSRLRGALAAGPRYSETGPHHPWIAVAREKGVSAYIGEGENRWPAAHISRCRPSLPARAGEGQAGARYHAVAEEGVPLKDIAERDRPWLERARHFHFAGTGPGAFRLFRVLRSER